ncbi:MAG: hypothetical protein IPP81_09355 [Chitinophagaceae bacterium]|nr:hypothetical protein [Chitinophagaceae bacterium]
MKPQILVDKICSDETLAQLKECLLVVVSGHMVQQEVSKDPVTPDCRQTGTAITAPR